MNDRDLALRIRTELGEDAAATLSALRRRLWRRRAANAGLVLATLALMVVAGVQLLARAVALEMAPLLHFGIVAVAVTAWATIAWLRRPGLVESARRADAELELRERLATALELIAGDRADDGPDGEQAGLAARQLVDTRSSLALVEARRAFPLAPPRRVVRTGAGAMALLLVLTVWPNPNDAVIRERQAAREASREVAERIERIADESERGAETENPERDRLVEQLRRLARELRDDGADRQETLARIGAVVEELSRMSDPQALARDAALSQLARATSEAATGRQQENPDGDPQQAAEQLDELAEEVDDLEPGDAAERSEALQRAADSAATSHPELARALREAAQALREAGGGDEADRRAAEEALRRAAEELRRADDERQLQRDIARAQSELQDGARQVARAGEPQPGASGQPGSSGQPGTGNQPGSSGQPGTGNQPGTQPGTGNQPATQPGTGNQPGSGGGATVRRIPGGGQRTGGFDGPTQDNKPFDVGETDFYAPFDRIGRPGDPSFVAGQGGDGGTDQTGSGSGIGFDNDSVVPYRSVFDLFRDFANGQLERQQVPITLKDLVRDYFTRLEPLE